MNVDTVPITALKPPERNVRLHPETQIVEFMRAIEMFGQTRPIVIDETDTILAGNGLYMALTRLGATEAAVLRVEGLSKGQKSKLMLSDNKIYALGHDDYDGIMGLIRGLDDLNIPGFDAGLLASLVSSDISTSQALNDFGRMSDEETASTTGRATRTHIVGGQTRVVCPHCGKEFAIGAAAA